MQARPPPMNVILSLQNHQRCSIAVGGGSNAHVGVASGKPSAGAHLLGGGAEPPLGLPLAGIWSPDGVVVVRSHDTDVDVGACGDFELSNSVAVPSDNRIRERKYCILGAPDSI